MTTSVRPQLVRTGVASALAFTLLVSGCTNGREGFTAERAAQIHAPSNAAQSETGYRELAEFADSGSGVKNAEDGRLVIDIAPSTATTIEFVHG